MRTVAAELVTILYDEGVGHLFVNPVMHTAALRAALAEADAAGLPHPQPVLCVHEHVALYAAHGHHLAGGAPQAAMVQVEGDHVDFGPVLENAVRDRAPLILFWGRDQARTDGGRSPSPPPPVCGKWSTDLSHGDLANLVRRAAQIARAEPGGLAHVSLRRDALAEPAGVPSRRLASPRLPSPDPTALDDMAELLAAAESPVIMAGRVGRNPSSVHELALLAETLGAPVIDIRNRVNMPPGHPLNAGMEVPDLLSAADAILMLDVEVPCLPGLGSLPQHAWILQIDAECLKTNLPCWTCPVEIAVTADTGLALAPLRTLLADRLTSRQHKVQERRDRVEQLLQARRETWRARAASAEPEDVADAMMAELQRALPEDAVVLEEAHASRGGALRQLERPPGHFFRSTAKSPGWAIGAAMGARLARPTQPVVAVCDDTAFAYGLPTAAFWSAHRAGAPFLAVVLDRAAGPAPRTSTRPTRLTRPTRQTNRRTADAALESDVVAMARACGAEAAVVTHPFQVAATVERLLATTRDGLCAVLDARLPRS
jgi:acetolactate synthase-1/2/3 large subunit